jgi:hypothetical protein
MKCLKLNSQMDVCVTVNTKLIFHRSSKDDLQNALQRNELMLRAQHLGVKHEASIAADIKAQLLKEDVIGLGNEKH